jgi:hypothetical protein
MELREGIAKCQDFFSFDHVIIKVEERYLKNWSKGVSGRREGKSPSSIMSLILFIS